MTNRLVRSRPSSRWTVQEDVRLVEHHGLDRAIELHVAPEVELVGDVLEIAQVLGLAGEALLPVPLLEQVVGERVPIGDALRIEAGPRIAVPVPGAADVGAGLDHGGPDAQLE